VKRPNITLYDNNTRPLMEYADHLEAEIERLNNEIIENHADLVRKQRIIDGVQSKTALDVVAEKMEAEDELRRLLRVMAAALERTQVDDSGEATMILEAEVKLDGSPADKDSNHADTG
jgi:hypothetical protein